MGKTMVSSHAGMNGSKKGSNASGYKKLGGGAGKKAGKGKDKVLHPNSRKAARAHRNVLRSEKMLKLKKGADKKKVTHGEKLLWFQDRLNEEDLVGEASLTLPQACQLVQEYVDRNLQDMEELKSLDSSRGRSTNASKIDRLKHLHQHEMSEFTAGIRLPDFTIPKAVRMLREWNLELNTMIAIPTRTFRQQAIAQ